MSNILTLDITEEKLFDMDFSPKMREADVITGIHDVEAFYDENFIQSADASLEIINLTSNGKILQFQANNIDVPLDTTLYIRARVQTSSDPILVGRGTLIISP